jgi:murein DD-endopeptidase MepM/ murein hydrolase activator NlpD
LREYKRLEGAFAAKAAFLIKQAAASVKRFFVKTYAKGTQRFTIMLVPHSEKKILNLQVSVFMLFFIAFVGVAVVGGFVLFSAKYSGAAQQLAKQEVDDRDLQASVDSLREGIQEVASSWKGFQAALLSTFKVIGIETGEMADLQGGDLAALLDSSEYEGGTLAEVSSLKRINGFLRSLTAPTKDLGELLKSQNQNLEAIPSIAPIKGDGWHVSALYGYAEEPFTGVWYLHKGIDLSTYRSGDPVVATADGKVVTIEYQPDGYGNYIIIEHKLGFFTRYAHLQRIDVSKGDKVQQGQVIGAIGNTGRSTGPHLHYEVMIGAGLVDPQPYVMIRSRR